VWVAKKKTENTGMKNTAQRATLSAKARSRRSGLSLVAQLQ